MMYLCVECGEPLDGEDPMDWEDEEEGYHFECAPSEAETEEDTRAVDAFVFMIGLEELAEVHEEAGDVSLAQRTHEALDAVAERYVELYTGEVP